MTIANAEPSGDDPDGRGEPAIDGRLLRGQRTRRAIAAAYLALLEQGDRSPSVDRVAALAGVGRRTVYNQFRDVEGLRSVAGALTEQRLLDLAGDPPDPTLPLAARLDQFVARRSTILETLAPYARAAEGRHHSSPELRRQRAHLVEQSKANLLAAFGRELDGLRGARRQQRLTALHAACSWPAWSVLRDELDLPVEQAAAVMRLTLAGLLCAPASNVG